MFDPAGSGTGDVYEGRGRWRELRSHHGTQRRRPRLERADAGIRGHQCSAIFNHEGPVDYVQRKGRPSLYFLAQL